MSTLSNLAVTGTITSELVTFKNRSGRLIIGFIDANADKRDSFIVIPPAFGETKRDSLKLSYFLAKNGFSVLRYDATDHVGESQGDMRDASFENMKNDLFAAIDFLQNSFKVEKVGIAGSSLGIRVALKAATQDTRISAISGIVGIVDLRSTLKAVYRQDVIGEIMEGKYTGKTIDDIMGFEVSVNFAVSAVQHGYHDLNSTREDFSRLSIPVSMLNAENDPWINSQDVRMLLEEAPGKNRKFVLIPAAMHQINENPEAAMFALKQIVVECKKHLLNEDIRIEDVALPLPQEISGQWLAEEKRLRNLLTKSLEGEKEFWEKYLNKFVLIHKSSDYRSFLMDVFSALGIRPGETVLDAGCGNGHFGAWLVDRMLEFMLKENIAQKDFKPLTYFGLDFTAGSLNEALLKHVNLSRKVYRELSLRDSYPIVKYRYILADLEKPLPVKDTEFDKICCNLVVSYVSDPGFSVREFARSLKPGGRILLSSMKPYADMSQIYRDFADLTSDTEELDEARKLLNAAGRIRQKESAGIYTFFSEDELRELLRQAGLKVIAELRTFGNQANLAMGEKQ